MTTQKILIVDDSKIIRMQLKEMLPRGNFEILEAKDGVEGFELIYQERPNLVLIDFFMPRMNGWEVVQKLQSFPKLQSIPIVMMSGRREDVEKTVPELFEYFEFVSKPFEQRLLIQAIQKSTQKAKERYQSLKQNNNQAIATTSENISTNPNNNGATANVILNSQLSEDVQLLKAQVAKLQLENSALKSEVLALKKKTLQILQVLKKNQST